MEDVELLRNEARRCRRMAVAVLGVAMAETLTHMADEYDRRADELSESHNLRSGGGGSES